MYGFQISCHIIKRQLMARIKSKKFTGVYQSKLTSGDISYSFTYKDADNKMQRTTVGKKSEGITEQYTHQKRNDTINLIRNGEDPISHRKKSKFKFKDVWELYVENKALSDAIRKDYKGRWAKHMEQDFSNTVTLEKLIAFRKRLEDAKKPLSARSIDMMIGMLGSAVRYYNGQPSNKNKIHDAVTDLRAYDKDHVTKKKKNERKVIRDRFLTKDEVNLLKEEIVELHPELKLFVALALSTGGRLGAIMALKAKDISQNKVTLIDEKDGGTRYDCILDTNALALVSSILEPLKANDNLFTLSSVSLQKRLQRVLNKLFNSELETTDRVNRVVVHSLRHTFASHLVMGGTPLIKVQKLLNHSDIKTTARYAHLDPDAGFDAVMELWS